MADQDFHLQLAKGTRPWRVRSYGVGLHPPVKGDSLPVDFKTNPARPTFQNNPSSYKCRKFSSLDERVQNFKGFKYEKVNYLKNFLEEEKPANRDTTAKAQIMKREIQERSRKTRDVQIVKDQNQKSKTKASNSTASQSPREQSAFLSTKLSPVCSVMQSMKRKVGGVEGEDSELNKKRRIEIIRDPRRRKREEEKLLEEDRAQAVKKGLAMKSPLPLKKRVVLSPSSDAVRDEAWLYQYRQEKELRNKEQELEEDKENMETPYIEKNKRIEEDKENRKNVVKSDEVEDGEWDGEEKSSPRSWDFRNRSCLTEEIQ